MGPRAGPDRCGKSRRTPGFDPRTVQLLSSLDTDYAIPAHNNNNNSNVIQKQRDSRYNSSLINKAKRTAPAAKAASL